ncbi:Rad17 cell cycle checkpoint protein-domain-containing protein [Fimicolochytrium jonesii]|uniref:Rad17 cell cycle checkpoint protein-domain-containing protein n=1 Tax=Fimicolochytrium jonesii TaxID=1396493 RepID=UPI0022FDED38|nr:Rad17 cell cycle checkpoint protein-domain-containing protein [Fimicolochytrium jonesii]KAI8815552.1 Rad17 cell cycle checkpoint protein-domain-containing protein [Fimicolochytrium jonesii]
MARRTQGRIIVSSDSEETTDGESTTNGAGNAGNVGGRAPTSSGQDGRGNTKGTPAGVVQVRRQRKQTQTCTESLNDTIEARGSRPPAGRAARVTDTTTMTSIRSDAASSSTQPALRRTTRQTARLASSVSAKSDERVKSLDAWPSASAEPMSVETCTAAKGSNKRTYASRTRSKPVPDSNETPASTGTSKDSVFHVSSDPESADVAKTSKRGGLSKPSPARPTTGRTTLAKRRKVESGNILEQLKAQNETARNVMESASTAPPARRKRFVIPGDSKHTATTPSEAVPDTKLWIDQYEPSSEEELAVNNKRIADVRDWLLKAITAPHSRAGRAGSSRTPKVLVLTGPCGAGKTAVVRMLAKDMALEIVEWSNPVNTNAMNLDAQEPLREGDYRRPYPGQYLSLSGAFKDFLGAAAKTPALSFHPGTTAASDAEDSDRQFYPSPSSLPIPKVRSNTPKIILIEDLPNVSHLATRSAIHSAIRSYVRSPRSRYPLVFIVTDVAAIDVNEGRRRMNQDGIITPRILIPPDVLSSAACKQISFNPIAPTYLVKALTRISELNFRFPHHAAYRPDKEMIQLIAKSSGGDIRCAINALQFLTLRDLKGMKAAMKAGKSKTAAKSEENSTMLEFVGTREVNLAIFHSLGKILYSKRTDGQFVNDTSSAQVSDLPPFLAQHRRPPLENNPENVIAASNLDAESFALFLHQNCLHFFADVDEVANAADYMSLTDTLCGNWQNIPALSPYIASIASRGLCFSHTHPVPPQRFRQLHRPDIWALTRVKQELQANVRGAALEWARDGCKEEGLDRRSVNAPLTGMKSKIAYVQWSGQAYFPRTAAMYSESALCHDILPYMHIINSGQAQQQQGLYRSSSALGQQLDRVSLCMYSHRRSR